MNQYNQMNHNQHNNNNNNNNQQYNGSQQQYHQSASNQNHGGYNQQYNQQYNDEYKEPKYDDSYNPSHCMPYIEPYDESQMTIYSPSTTSIHQNDHQYDHHSYNDSNSNQDDNHKFNQYHPKAKEEFVETKKKHIYNIRAHFENNILSIEVYDAYQRKEFRNEFTQKCFPNAQIYFIAKALIETVNSLYFPGKKKGSIVGFEPITIYEYGNWCYVTVNGADIPSFALRPIQIAHH